MLSGIGEAIIIFMLLLIGVVIWLLIHQIKMIVREDREFKAFMKEIRNEP